MSICPIKTIPHEMKTSRICVYSYENKLLKGILSNPFFEKEMIFENVMQLITMMEYISNEYLYPQKTMELRKFPSRVQAKESKGFDFKTSSNFSNISPLATFEIELIFRQNASWQGNIRYCEQNVVISFRSMLELLTLIDSAITG